MQPSALSTETQFSLKAIPGWLWAFATLWLAMGLAQCALMDLHPDEAYYWQMGCYPAWGYFHQPPMVSVFIHFGYAFLHHELGVRLATTLASTALLFMVWWMGNRPSASVFIGVFGGLALTHAGAFMAVPDSPLTFFTALFLLLLPSYLNTSHWWRAIVLGVVAAALLYSKYHGLLLLFAVVVAAPTLLLRPTFWLAAVVGLALYFPHIQWQIDHQWVSFRFHWQDRDISGWNPTLVLEYVGGQLVLLGPVGILSFLSLRKWKPTDAFERVLISVALVFFGVFLALSFRGRVENNWTASAFIPLMVLALRRLPHQPSLLPWLRRAAWVTIPLLVAGRLYLMSPIAGQGLHLNYPLTGWKAWATTLRTEARGLPVVFTNGYQYPSAYTFYTGQQGYHRSLLNYTGNQFDLWNIDSVLCNRPVVLYSGWGTTDMPLVKTPSFRTLHRIEVNDACQSKNLWITLHPEGYRASLGNAFTIQAYIGNNGNSPIKLDELMQRAPLQVLFYQKGKQTTLPVAQCNQCDQTLPPNTSAQITLTLTLPPQTGSYLIRLGFMEVPLFPTRNSDLAPLTIE